MCLLSLTVPESLPKTYHIFVEGDMFTSFGLTYGFVTQIRPLTDIFLKQDFYPRVDVTDSSDGYLHTGLLGLILHYPLAFYAMGITKEEILQLSALFTCPLVPLVWDPRGHFEEFLINLKEYSHICSQKIRKLVNSSYLLSPDQLRQIYHRLEEPELVVYDSLPEFLDSLLSDCPSNRAIGHSYSNLTVAYITPDDLLGKTQHSNMTLSSVLSQLVMTSAIRGVRHRVILVLRGHSLHAIRDQALDSFISADASGIFAHYEFSYQLHYQLARSVGLSCKAPAFTGTS